MQTFLEAINAVESVSVAIAADVEAFYGGTIITPPAVPFGKNEIALKIQRVTTPVELAPGGVASCIGSLMDTPATASTAVTLPSFTEKLGNTLIAITATFQAVVPAAVADAPAPQAVAT